MQLSTSIVAQRTSLEITPSPFVQRRRLRTELRRARSAANLTQEQVATAMDWSLSKIIRIETGAVSVSTNDLKALLRLYEVDDADRTNELVELARVSRQTSWWSKYRGNISLPFFQLIEYEQASSVLRIYEPLLVPGLLQTAKYADQAIRNFSETDTPEDLIRTRIEIRQARQQLLEQSSPPTMMFVLDEAVAQHLVGKRSIAYDQIDRLMRMASRPNVTIELIPFSAGLYRGMLESFTVVEFPDPEDSDVLYRETSRDSIISRGEAEEISGYREVFENLRDISLGPDDTLTYLTKLLKKIPS